MSSNTLTLAPGTRLRTGGTTYEVTDKASVPAGVVPVVPQPARLLKVFCETCGYTARITQRWITRAGTPECPSGHGHMVVEAKKEKPAKATLDKRVVDLSVELDTPTPATSESLDSVLEELVAELKNENEPREAVEDTSSATTAPKSTLAQLLAEL